jgi:pimeloyl-ACP methyl ester carboxylesterase
MPSSSSTSASEQPSSTPLSEPRRLREFRSVRFHQVTSADGTVVEAWTNAVEDGPVVLLCNGLGTNPYSWPALLDPACGIRVVSWNHRGVGRSERPADPQRVGVDAFVEDAVAVLDAFDVERCVVAGWSIGVNTAFELALHHPGRVAGLFAVAGVPGGTFASMGAPLLIPRPLRRPLSTTAARAMKATGPLLTQVARRIPMGPVSTTALRFSGFMFPLARHDEVRRTVREFLTTPVDWYMHMALHASRHDRVSLSGVSVPAVFVSGTYDILASARDMRTAAARIEGATYTELFGTHFIPLERSPSITGMLRELAQRVHTG